MGLFSNLFQKSKSQGEKDDFIHWEIKQKKIKVELEDGKEDEVVINEPEVTDDDADINSKLDTRKAEADAAFKAKLEEFRENEIILEGSSDLKTIPNHQSRTNLQIIWADYRTQVGMLGDQNPKIVCLATPEIDEDSKGDPKATQKIINAAQKSSKLIEQATDYLWQYKIRMSRKMRPLYWSLAKNQVGFLMPRWDYLKDEIETDYVPERYVTMSPGALDPDDAEYVFVDFPKNKKWFRQNFPEDWGKILYQTASSEEWYLTNQGTITGQPLPGSSRQSIGMLQMYFEDEICIYRARSVEGSGWIVLKKGANPLYDFDYQGYQGDVSDEFPEDNPNIFDNPRKPLVMFNLPEDESPYPQTVTKRVNTIQKDINEQKRQINNNSRGSNGVLFVDAETMTEQEAKKVDFTKSNLVVRIKGLRDNPRAFQWLFPQQISNVVGANLDNSLRMIDRIIGLEASARGEFNPSNKTKGGIEALQSASQVPVRELSRAVENGISDLAMFWLQMMKMFYDRPHWVRRFGDEDREPEALTSEDIVKGLSVTVKEGSMMPRPEEQIQTLAVDLAARKLLSPQSMFERLKYADPKREAVRLLNWMNGMISDEVPESTEEQDPELSLADKENESLMAGKPAAINPTDDDAKHLMVHAQLQQRPEVDQNEAVAAALAEHIQAHTARLAQKGQNVPAPASTNQLAQSA